MVLTLVALLAFHPGLSGKAGHRLVQEWIDPQFEPRNFQKLFIIGIAGLTQERKHFENKFVSHLRADTFDGVTSHSIVPDLDRIENREAIVQALEEREVEGAITVRLVPLEDRTERQWGEAWTGWANSAPRIRDLIEATLPVATGEARMYGVEVALWEATNWNLVWAGRTDSYRRKELSKEAGTFVQFTLDALWEADLVRRQP